jgi:hypothetical protein
MDSLRALAALCALAAAGALAQTNPAARPARDAGPLAGTWNGAHLEQRSGCATEGNNGFHGTYSEYTFRVNTASQTLTLDELAITGLACSYSGPYRVEEGRLLWSGNHSCSDFRAGPFEAQNVFALTKVMSIRLAIRLTSGEHCTIDAVVSGARF